MVTGRVATAVTVTFREGGHCPGKVTGGDGHSREVVTEGGMVTAGEGKSAGGDVSSREVSAGKSRDDITAGGSS